MTSVGEELIEGMQWPERVRDKVDGVVGCGVVHDEVLDASWPPGHQAYPFLAVICPTLSSSSFAWANGMAYIPRHRQHTGYGLLLREPRRELYRIRLHRQLRREHLGVFNRLRSLPARLQTYGADMRTVTPQNV
jgi:hypothetical protein